MEKYKPLNKGGKNAKDRKYVMTTDDLANAMADQGITVKKPPYFT